MFFRSIQHGLSLCIPAHQLLCSVGIELKEEEAFLSPTSSPIIQGRKKQQQLQDQSFPDYVISFRQTFPLHVYDVSVAAHPYPVLTFLALQIQQTCGGGCVIFIGRKCQMITGSWPEALFCPPHLGFYIIFIQLDITALCSQLILGHFIINNIPRTYTSLSGTFYYQITIHDPATPRKAPRRRNARNR